MSILQKNELRNFEPADFFAGKVDTASLGTTCSGIRKAWDDFRTSPWLNIIKYPESFIQQGIQLLSVVNVQF